MGELDIGARTFSKIFSLSFSGKKIAVQIIGLLCAFVAWSIIKFIGVAALAEALDPVVRVVSWVVVVFIMFLTWGAIAKITVAEVAELPAVDAKGAVRSALRNATPLIVAPLKIVAIILIMALLHVIVGWVGLIPFIGEIIWSLMAIPLFVLSALIVVASIILLCGALLLPTIIMAGKESPVSELNDFLRENALRFIGYLIATLIVVAVVTAFLNYVVLTNSKISSAAMGEKYSHIVSCAPERPYTAIDKISIMVFAPLKTQALRDYQCFLMKSMLITREGVAPSDLGWSYKLAGLIWGIFTFIINLAIRSLPLVIFSVSGTLIYLGLKPSAIPKPAQASPAEKAS
jgi:hypothetical protein